MEGVAAQDLYRLTAAPRRYGWHATLKAPFALAPGVDWITLHQAVRAAAHTPPPPPRSPAPLRLACHAQGAVCAGARRRLDHAAPGGAGRGPEPRALCAAAAACGAHPRLSGAGACARACRQCRDRTGGSRLRDAVAAVGRPAVRCRPGPPTLRRTDTPAG